jgi:glycosyltransferase involved in cell wall biosynthesis
VHTAFYNLKPRNVLIDKFLGKFTDEVIYVSNASRKSFSAKGYKTGRSIIIYNGVDSFAFKVNRNLLKKRVITIVASLKDFKGHIYLLKAIRRVLEEMPDLELWIVGDGPLRPDLEKSAEALGIGDSVFFLGRKDNIGDILGETSVFALSSLREGLPVALVEALASGLPVIGTNAGGIPEVIKDKENGFVVLAGEERALSKAILDIFNNPEKLEKMGLRSRELFEQYFSLNIMINKLDVLYQNLLKKKR